MLETFLLLYIGTGIGIWFMVFCDEETEFRTDLTSWWFEKAFDFVATVAFMWMVFAYINIENAILNHKIRQKEK